jgi:hypothetical protein
MESLKKYKPSQKVQSGINWGALATIAVGLYAVYYPDDYALWPPALEGAIVGFVVSFANYWTRER